MDNIVSKSKQKIIVLEGIDGSGKTVQFDMLKEAIASTGHSVETRDFPAYDSFFGKIIGELLSGSGEVGADEIDPKSMAMLFAMDRFNDFSSRNTDDSDYLLINRYVLSNAVYQSIRSDDENMCDWILNLEHNVLGLPVPDAYIFFDVDENQAKQNVSKKGHRDYVSDEYDVYESSETIQTSARCKYLECASKCSNIIVIQCMRDGTLMSVEDVHKSVMDALMIKGLL